MSVIFLSLNCIVDIFRWPTYNIGGTYTTLCHLQKRFVNINEMRCIHLFIVIIFLLGQIICIIVDVACKIDGIVNRELLLFARNWLKRGLRSRGMNPRGTQYIRAYKYQISWSSVLLVLNCYCYYYEYDFLIYI